MHRVLTGGILSVAVAFGLALGANAQVVEKSGNTFHVAACGPVPAGFARCHAHVVTDIAGHTITTDGSRITGYIPSDLRDAYKVTGNGSSSTIIAIVDAFGYAKAESDLGVYRAQFSIPDCTTANGCFKKLNQNGEQGNYPPEDKGWATESALDLDMASAMCPSCKLILVEGNTNNYNDLATAVNTAAAQGAHVISNSYGGGESGTQSFESAYNHAGVAITASTGDHGFAAGPQFPATSPHVIAVGGTHLTRDSSQRGWTESAWSGAGSGCSTVYAKPSWQKDSKCTKRMEADVSAVADPATGVAVYGPFGSGSGWFREGGTSVSAPLVAGVYGVNGKKVKNDAKTLYGKKASLFDVTSGNNGTSCGGTYYCIAGPGYDGPTGLGTPNGTKSFH